MPDDTAVPGRTSGRGSIARRLARSNFALNTAAVAIATGLRFVNFTTRTGYEPRPPEDIFAAWHPMIITAWHGQAFMLPFVRPKGAAVDVLASRHADGELIARTLVRLGCGVIRGSGAAEAGRMHEKGALAGFRGMLTALAKGRSVALTADFIKTERRKVGLGVVTVAKMSGRPIVPVAFLSSRRREIGSSWDRTTLSLPFGRASCVVGDAIWVDRRADDSAMEHARATVERTLNAVNDRALAIVDARHG